MTFTPIVCLGLSHHTAPIELRERLNCSLDELSPLLSSASALPARHHLMEELAIISTCNRFEIYARVDLPGADAQALLAKQLAAMRGIAQADFNDHLYFYMGKDAVRHLFSVAAGLDSMVLGEPQILGQVTDAYMQAVETKTIGAVLTALFRAAIRVGKRARTDTAISSKPASISSVAVAKAEQIIGDLRERRPLIVGMGEMGKLAMKSLKARGVQQIAIANRSRQRAEAYAEGCGGNAYTMAELAQALAEADLVFSATGAPHVIINPEMVCQSMKLRDHRELVLVDIAVPRDIDPAVSEIPGVHLFDVDDLQGGLDEALAARRREVPHVQEIVEGEVVAFQAQLQEIGIKPLVVDLRQKAEAIRQQELRRVLRYMGDVDSETLEQLQLFSRSLVNKLLHEPTIRLKEKASNGQSAEYAATVRHLFGLESNIEIN